MHAEIARLLVLYEDLKIESHGITRRIRGLGTTNDGEYVQRYFIRRSIATLEECADCITSLNRIPDFQKIKDQTFDQEAKRTWNKAVTVLSAKKPKWLIKEIRNDVGAHFGLEPAKRAIAGLKPGTIGKIEYRKDLRSSAKTVDCHFVGELTARAFLKDQKQNPEAQFKELLRVTADAQGVVLRAVPYLIYFYVGQRFDKR